MQMFCVYILESFLFCLLEQFVRAGAVLVNQPNDSAGCLGGDISQDVPELTSHVAH
jgi:hypothetical protein